MLWAVFAYLVLQVLIVAFEIASNGWIAGIFVVMVNAGAVAGSLVGAMLAADGARFLSGSDDEVQLGTFTGVVILVVIVGVAVATPFFSKDYAAPRFTAALLVPPIAVAAGAAVLVAVAGALSFSWGGRNKSETPGSDV